MKSSPLTQEYIDEARRPDGEARVHEGLARKLGRIAANNPVVSLARKAYGYMTDPAVPRRYKLLLIAGLLYFIAPLDAVPDVIPGLGFGDDLLVLSAIVAAVYKVIHSAKENAREVIREAEETAGRVVRDTLSEARETWARRGVAQVALCLWGATTAAAVGLVAYGTRSLVLENGAVEPLDPFLWAVVLTSGMGFVYNVLFLKRLWNRYSGLPGHIREPLAYAVISLLHWRQVAILSLPVIALLAIMVLRVALAGYPE